MAMDSPDRSSPSSAGEIQGSPLFNFLCSLSPIKPVKSARVAQTYSEISFPPPPAVFVSPRVDARKDASSLQRNRAANGVEEAPTASETGSVGAQKEGKHVIISSSQRVQKLRSIRKSHKSQSFPSPSSSPSKLVEEYLAPPVDEDSSADEDLELLPSSSTCEAKATSGDTDSMQVDGMEFSKEEEIVLKALPKLLGKNGSYMGRIGSMENRCTANIHEPKSFSAISSLKHIDHESGDINNEAILDFHQEAADLEFLMSEDVDESHHPPGMEDWHNVTSSNLSELSVEQVEGYIASLRGIVNEEEEVVAGFSTQLSTDVMADENLMTDNPESESEANGNQVAAATCKVSASHQRGVRRRCLDFEVSQGHMQSENSILSLKSMPPNSRVEHQKVPLCGAESNRSLLVLKKRVSATLGAMKNDAIQGFDACTGGCSRKDGTASIKMTRATSINIKLSRCSSLKEIDSRLPCAKTSPVPAGMPSGIGLHLNSLTSSMPCAQMREIDGSSGPATTLKPGNTLSGGMHASKLQGSPVESSKKCLVPLNPGRHAYAGSTAESRQGLVALVPETRMDDCEVHSESSDQDIDSSKSAICLPLGNTLVHDVVPLNVYKRPSPLSRKRVLLQDKYHQQGELEGGEESNQSPYSPKKKRRSSSTAEKSGDGCKRCNCKKSKCLKLYCECFAAGVYCVDSCTCQGCFNKPEFEETVMDTRQQIMSRNPLAFAPKIIRASESSPTKREDSRDTPASARHKRGCNCKKSHCLKKYCECFQAGVGCSDGCRCESCKNVHGRKEGSQDADENDFQVEAVVDREFAEEHIETSELCTTELIHGSQHQNHELSPITPAFQHGGQHRSITKSSTSIKRRSSLEALRSPSFSLSSIKPCRSPSKMPRSPSRLLRSCKGAQTSPPTMSTGVAPSGSSPVSTPRILRIGRFSPRWDGLDEICTLTPGIQAPLRPTPASASVLDRADMSPSMNEQNCHELLSTGNGPVRQRSKFSCLTSPISQQQSSQCRTPANTQGTPATRTPFSPASDMDNKPFYEESKAYAHQFMEDNGTPEFLKEAEPEYLPICLLNSSSPKHKRVSPPHHHALREATHRGMQSPGVRSSRKFILQSISSLPPTPFTAGHEKLKGE